MAVEKRKRAMDSKRRRKTNWRKETEEDGDEEN